jgi:hypothetical protein
VWRQLTPDDTAKLEAEYTSAKLQPLKKWEVWALGADGTRTIVAYEIHVDELDGEHWLKWREKQPMGGELSARGFEGDAAKAALKTALTGLVVLDLPQPGADVAGELQIIPEEEAAGTSASATGSEPPVPAPSTDAALTPDATLTAAYVGKLRVADLSQQLRLRALPTSGLKAALVARLLAHLADEQPHEEEDEVEEEEDKGDYVVARILDCRVNGDADGIHFGRLEYHVLWESGGEQTGVEAGEQTWEPLSNLHNCEEVFHTFFSTNLEPSCKYGHRVGMCRCSNPVLKFGHDESIFKAYQKSTRTVLACCGPSAKPSECTSHG